MFVFRFIGDDGSGTARPAADGPFAARRTAGIRDRDHLDRQGTEVVFRYWAGRYAPSDCEPQSAVAHFRRTIASPFTTPPPTRRRMWKRVMPLVARV